MGHVLLVTGGCRSGKTAYAQERAEAAASGRIYLATATLFDEEMRARAERHQQERAGRGWSTVEEPYDLVGALVSLPETEEAVLVDSLTLWIATHQHENGAEEVSEEAIALEAALLAEACRRRAGTVVLVTDEVGLGIVPANAEARLFRDLLGRCNQTVAAAADEVVLMSCGLPLWLKGGPARVVG